jgi:hypothetical protein
MTRSFITPTLQNSITPTAHRGIISQIIGAEAKGFIQQGLLLTVHFVFGQRGE